MKSLLLFLSLSCLGAAADKAPPPPLCHLEFNSFSLGVNGTTKEPYCILSLKGRPLEHLSVVFISKERPFDLSVTDSTGKTYALNHVLIEPAWEKSGIGKKSSICAFLFPNGRRNMRNGYASGGMSPWCASKLPPWIRWRSI